MAGVSLPTGAALCCLVCSLATGGGKYNKTFVPTEEDYGEGGLLMATQTVCLERL